METPNPNRLPPSERESDKQIVALLTEIRDLLRNGGATPPADHATFAAGTAHAITNPNSPRRGQRF